jgi:rubrerythrin
MHNSFLLLAFLAAFLGGCTSMPPSLVHSGADPSNPSAPEASAGRFRPHLVATTKVYLDPSAGQGTEKMDMSKMQPNAGMQGADHSKMPAMSAPSPAANAAEKPGDKSHASAQSHAVFYTCRMHPQIHEGKPGQCPICGMTLVKKKGP